jgi:Fe-S cluster assembly iron-binding protein IscA
MFTVTEEAKTEIQKRLIEFQPKNLVRLQMRHSCYMKLKLTLEETIQPNDTEEFIDGLHFIIDKDHVHYFNNKKIDFITDKFGFKEFEAI